LTASEFAKSGSSSLFIVVMLKALSEKTFFTTYDFSQFEVHFPRGSLWMGSVLFSTKSPSLNSWGRTFLLDYFLTFFGTTDCDTMSSDAFSSMKFSWSDLFGPPLTPTRLWTRGFQLRREILLPCHVFHPIIIWHDIDMSCPSIWVLKSMPQSVMVWRCFLKRNLDPTMLWHELDMDCPSFWTLERYSHD
jgi:hypothetical protein